MQVGERGRVAGSAAAFALALAGTEMLGRPEARPAGFALIVVGAVAAAALLPGPRWAFGPLRVPERWPRSSWIGVACAMAVLVAADVKLLRDPAPRFGITEGLWGCALVLFAFFTRRLAPPSAPDPDERAGRRLELGVLALLVVLGLAVRVVALREVPFAIHGDEILTGRIARHHFLPWKGTTVFTTVWDAIDLPALWFLLVAGSLKLFGTTLAALRLPAALFGVATIVPFWALCRELYGRRASLLASALFAAGAANVHFARITVNNITAAFFWTLCFALLLRGLRTEEPFPWAMAGLAGGLGEHFYYGTRLLPFVLLGFALSLAVLHRERLTRLGRQLLLLALGYFIGIGPLLAHFRTHPGLYLGRGSDVLPWKLASGVEHGTLAIGRRLAAALYRNVLGVSTIGDTGSLYTAPLLGILEAALLAIGLAILARSWRNPAALLVLGAAAGTVFVGGTLVPPAPALQHWTPAFGCIYAILAAPLAGWLELAERLPGATVRRCASTAALVVVVVSCVLSLRFYFTTYYSLRPEYEVRAAQSRFETGLGRAYGVYTPGETWQPYDEETNAYLLAGQPGGRIRDPERGLPPTPQPGHGLAFLFFRDNESWLPLVRTRYPGAREVEVKSRGGTHLFFAYVVDPR